MSATITRVKLSPPAVAKRLGVATEKITTWIKSGELRAVNLATRSTGRPRYAVDLADLQAFENRRTVSADVAPAPRNRRADGNVTAYF